MLTNPWAPMSVALGGSIFSMRHLLAYGHRPGGSRLSASPRTVLSRFLSFVQHVHNGRQRCHGERNNSRDDGEGLAGPMDGLIQRPLLIREARIIGHMSATTLSFACSPVLVQETEVVAQVLLRW